MIFISTGKTCKHFRRNENDDKKWNRKRNGPQPNRIAGQSRQAGDSATVQVIRDRSRPLNSIGRIRHWSRERDANSQITHSASRSRRNATPRPARPTIASATVELRWKIVDQNRSYERIARAILDFKNAVHKNVVCSFVRETTAQRKSFIYFFTYAILAWNSTKVDISILVWWGKAVHACAFEDW